MITSPLFEGDVVLMVSSVYSLQYASGQFTAKCQAAVVKVQCLKKMDCSLQVVGRVSCCPKGRHSVFWELFSSDGNMGQNIDRQLGVTSSVLILD